MTREHDETLQAIAEETFESLAFVLAMPEEMDDAADEPLGPGVTARISFTGPFEGTLFLAASADVVEPTAANMLALIDGEVPTGEQQADAFRELLNVICGNLLPALAGTAPVFDVGAAEILGDEPIPEQFQQRPPTATVRLCLEFGPAELALFVHGEVAVEAC